MKRCLYVFSFASFFVAVVFIGATWLHVLPPPDSLEGNAAIRRFQVFDREGKPLARTYQNDFNIYDRLSLSDIPKQLQTFIITSEDKRFYQHNGIDWDARLSAIRQNLFARRAIRGASTITEQVIRILHPRKRTLWSRWIEGFEAQALEQKFSKNEILEFYLNQIPYARNRRGVSQAARDLFQREVGTLNTNEMLALAVLPRAPSRLDPRNGQSALKRRTLMLASQLHANEVLSAEEVERVQTQMLVIAPSIPLIDAGHFLRALGSDVFDDVSSQNARIATTLDSNLQEVVQKLLESRIHALSEHNVHKAACIVIDHRSNEILAWANASRGAVSLSAADIDGVLMRRQPGSALKPFLYAMALERGYTASSLLDDSPLVRQVGFGLHHYRNYSQKYYGPVRLREALGNSLNLPAIRLSLDISPSAFLDRLHSLGFSSLKQQGDFYGEGLALGNGEVTLFELARAYAVLARGGIYQDISPISNTKAFRSRRIFLPEISSLISNILSDPEARELEFGRTSLLRFPTQTAVKTGTSTDFRDAWAVAYSDKHTVAVWMGNADQTPMAELAGAMGPGLVLRGVFSELNRHRQNRTGLQKTDSLVRKHVCRISGELPSTHCPLMSELFVEQHQPTQTCDGLHKKQLPSSSRPLVKKQGSIPQISKPTPGLLLAKDPRIPDAVQAFPFQIEEGWNPVKVRWFINDQQIGESNSQDPLLWPVERGNFRTHALLYYSDSEPELQTPTINFEVR